MRGVLRKNKKYRWSDLTWTSTALFPRKINDEGGTRRKLRDSRPESPKEIAANDHRIVISSTSGKGKVTDCGYDSMVACYTRIPAGFDITMQADVAVEAFFRNDSANGQEAFGLFLRDTMKAEPETGLYYSNMAAVGGWQKELGFFGRSGICGHSIETARNFSEFAKSGGEQPENGAVLHLVISKKIPTCT